MSEREFLRQLSDSSKKLTLLIQQKKWRDGLAESSKILKELQQFQQKVKTAKCSSLGQYFGPSSNNTNETFCLIMMLTLLNRANCVSHSLPLLEAVQEFQVLYPIYVQWHTHAKGFASVKEKLMQYAKIISAESNKESAEMIWELCPHIGDVIKDDMSIIINFSDLLFSLGNSFDKKEYFQAKLSIFQYMQSFFDKMRKENDDNAEFVGIQTSIGLISLINSILQIAITSNNIDKIISQHLEKLTQLTLGKKFNHPSSSKMIGAMLLLKTFIYKYCLPSTANPTMVPLLQCPNELYCQFETLFLAFLVPLTHYGSLEEGKSKQILGQKWQMYLACISSSFQRKDYMCTIRYLKESIDMLKKEKDYNQIKSVSFLYYNYAVVLFKENHNLAINFAQESYDLYADCIDNHCEEDKGELVKRQSLVTRCLNTGNKKEDDELQVIIERIVATIQTKKYRDDLMIPLVKSFVSNKLKLLKLGNKNVKDIFLYPYLRQIEKRCLSTAQLGALLEEEFGLYESYWAFDIRMCLTVSDQLLNIYVEDLFPIQRAYTLIDKHRLLRNPDNNLSIEGLNEAIRILTSSLENELVIESDVLDILATGHMWVGILQRESDQCYQYTCWMESLSRGLLLWTRLLKNCASPDSLEFNSKIRRPQYTLNLLEQISDLFDLILEHEKQIHALELIVLLHQTILSKSSDSFHNIVITQARIGAVYNKLGYGGLAESYYNSAKKIIVKEKLDILPKTIEGKLMNVDWLLCLLIGEVESIGELKQFQESLQDIYVESKSVQTSSLLARFTSLISSIYQQECRIEESLSESLLAMNIWLIMLPQKGSQLFSEKKSKRNKIRKFDGVIYIFHASTDSTETNHNSLFNKWGVLRDLISSLLQIGSLYEQLGAFREADYYYHKALNFATALSIPRLKSIPLVKLAALYDKRKDVNQSLLYFELLKEVEAETSKIIRVESNETMGDFQLRQKETEVASQSYNGAERCLSELMDQSYILELVNIVTSSHPELTPHEKKIVSRVKGNKLSSKNTPTTGKKKLLIDDMNEESPSLIDEDDSECIPLKYVENRIISKKGDIELEKGNLDEAEEIFRQGLKKFTKLKKTIKSKKYDIDKVVLLFNLGRVSLSKSIQVNPDIIHILWEKPYSIIHRLEKERDAVIEEYSKMMGADEDMEVESPAETNSKSQTRKNSQKTTRKSKGTKQTRKIKQVRIERTAEYYIERAKYIFNISLGYCINCGTIPKMTQDICQQLALATGNTCPEKTAAYLCFSVGITFVNSELVNLTRKILEEKQWHKTEKPDEISEITSKLGKMTIGSKDNQTPISESESSSLDSFERELFTGANEKVLDFIATFINLQGKSKNHIQQHINNSGSFYGDYYKSLSKIRDNIIFQPDKFQIDIIDTFPSDWTVCNLSVTNDLQYLVITRLQARRVPLVMRIQLNEKLSCVEKEKNPKDQTKNNINIFEQVHKEFASLLARNKQHLSESKEQEKAQKEESFKSKWWTTRNELDLALKKLIGKKIPDKLIAQFRSPKIQKAFEDKLDAITEKVENISGYKLPVIKKELLFALLCGIGWLSKKEILKCLSTIVNWELVECDTDEADQDTKEELLNEIEKLLSKQYFNIISNVGDVTHFPWIADTLIGTRHHESKPKNSLDYALLQRHSPLILILDKHLHDLPIESIPILMNQPVSRMASIILMKSSIDRCFLNGTNQYLSSCVPKMDKLYFILNPDGSSSSIDDMICPLLKKYNLNQGVIGKKEKEELTSVFKDALRNDILLYCGHNDGEQYISREDIRDISKCKVALLMGCSSVLMETNGDYEPSGSLLSYMLSDCHATIGNLWVVTDRDLNLSTYSLLNNWFQLAEGNSLSLLDCIAYARKSCKFEYINGSSLVYYGLPNVFVQRMKV